MNPICPSCHQETELASARILCDQPDQYRCVNPDCAVYEKVRSKALLIHLAKRPQESEDAGT